MQSKFEFFGGFVIVFGLVVWALWNGGTSGWFLWVLVILLVSSLVLAVRYCSKENNNSIISSRKDHFRRVERNQKENAERSFPWRPEG